MRLSLVRHPRPLVGANICYGSTDVAVAPHEQAQVLPALLASLPTGRRLLSSPLQRCAGLASQLVAPLGCPSLEIDARLAEMDFGNWELRAWDDIARAEIDTWAQEPISYRPGGGESVRQMAQRIRAVYAELLATQQDCIIVCHAGTIRLLLACRQHLSIEEIAMHATRTRHRIPYGEVLILDC